MLKDFDLGPGISKVLSSGNLVFFAKNLNEEFVFVSDNIDSFGISKIKLLSQGSFYYYSLVSAEYRQKELQTNADFLLNFNQVESTSTYLIKLDYDLSYKVEERKWKSFNEFGEIDLIYGILFFYKDSVFKGFPFSSDNVFDIFNKSPDSICIMNSGFNEIVFSNSSFKEMFGNVSVFNFDNFLSNKSFVKYFNLNSEFRNLELQFSTLRGNKWLSCNAHSYFLADQKFSILFMYDISNKKSLEKEIESFYDFENILSTSILKLDSGKYDIYDRLLSKAFQFSGFTSGFFGEYIHANEEPTISISSLSIDNAIINLPYKGLVIPKSKILKRFKDILEGENFVYNDFYDILLKDLFLVDIFPDLKIRNFTFLKQPSKTGSTFFCFLFNSTNVPKSSFSSFDYILRILNVFVNFKYLYSFHESNLLKGDSLNETNKIYSLLIENMDDVVGIVDKKFIVGFVSPSIYRVCGIEDQILLNKSIYDFFDIKGSISSFRADFFKEVFSFEHYIYSRELKLEFYLKPIYNDKSYLEFYFFKIRDVTMEDKYLNDLRISLSKEKEINEIKSKILSLSSHEYRTPLSVIQSSADILQLLLPDFNVDERVFKLLKKINVQVEKLSSIISQTLIFDNDSKKISFNKEVFDLYQLILNLINADFSKFKVHVDVNKKTSKVFSDPYIVSKILKVLLDNATIYSINPYSTISIQIYFEVNLVNIIITDSGIGIPESDQKFIFNPFFRGTNVKNIKGSGLSLSLASELSKKINGSISLLSSSVSGSSFLFSFRHEV